MTLFDRIQRRVKRTVHRLTTPQRPPVFASYAQAGEDSILSFLFSSKGISHFEYLDIGVCQPDAYNNTFAFYKAGCRGVCVEPDPALIPAIRRVRPEDKVINAGVGGADHASLTFFVFNEPSLNTFNADEARRRTASGKFQIVKTIEVPVYSVNRLILEHCDSCPILLSLDAEGLDYEILEALDLNAFPIPVICVETCGYSETHLKPKCAKTLELMRSRGYSAYADTYINSIFVRSDWFREDNRPAK